MKCIIIFGPQAVGKMTVGQELVKITDLKLLHNHMTIDLALEFFPYGNQEQLRLSNLFREEIFKSVAGSDLEGMVFTYVWAFDLEEDREYVENVSKIFTDQGGEMYFVELEADVDERLKRNAHEHRLQHKPSKRNTKESEKNLKETMEKHRLNSSSGEITYKNYIRIDNTELPPEAVAQQIKEEFNL